MSEANLLRCLIYAVGRNYKGSNLALDCMAARGEGRQVTLMIGGQRPTDAACRQAIETVLEEGCDGCGAFRGHRHDCPLDDDRAAMRRLVR